MKTKLIILSLYSITAFSQGFDPFRTSPESKLVDSSKDQGSLGTYPNSDQRKTLLDQFAKSQSSAQDTLKDLQSVTNLGSTYLSSDGQTAESYPKQRADLIKARGLFEDFGGAVQDLFDPTKVAGFRGEAEASYNRVREEVLQMVQDKKDAVANMNKVLPTLNMKEGDRKEALQALDRANKELDLTAKAFAQKNPGDYTKALDLGIYQIGQFKQTAGGLTDTWKKTVDNVATQLQEDVDRSNLFLEKLRNFKAGTPEQHDQYKRDMDQLRFEMASQKALSNGKYMKLSADLATKNLNELADEMGITLDAVKNFMMNDKSFDEALRNTPMGQYVNKQIAKALGGLCDLKNKCEDPNMNPDKAFEEMFYFLDNGPRGNYLYDKKLFNKFDSEGNRKYYNASPR